jgi:predicted MFS family arabinose efflux permease
VVSAQKKWHIMVLVISVAFLLGCGVDLYVPSLPIITRYFGTSSDLVQLSISFYMLGYALGQVILGILSDGVGRKKILIFSGVVFTAVSIFVVFAPNIYVLNFCRLLQGIFIGGLGAVMRAVATDFFVGPALNRAVAWSTTSWALGPIIGPTIGSYLQHFFNWQADFYFFSLYGLFVTIYCLLILPETHFNLIPLHPVKIYRTMKEVFFHPIFLLFSIFGALIYALGVVFNVIGPFLIQEVLHYSVVEYGHIALILGIGTFLGCLLNRFLINRFDSVKIAIIGLIFAIVVVLAMIVFGLIMKINLFIIMIPAWLLFFLSGLILPNIFVKIVKIFPHLAGTTSSIYGFLMAGGVFLMSSASTKLNAFSQMPMAFFYMALLLVCWSMFVMSKKIESKKKIYKLDLNCRFCSAK